jgi:hypothetical protein
VGYHKDALFARIRIRWGNASIEKTTDTAIRQGPPFFLHQSCTSRLVLHIPRDLITYADVC